MYNFPRKAIYIRNLKSRNFLIHFFFFYNIQRNTFTKQISITHSQFWNFIIFFTSVIRAAIVRRTPEPLHTFRGGRIPCIKKCRQMAPTPFHQAKTYLFFSFPQQPCFFRGAGVFNFLNLSILYDTFIEWYNRLKF